MNNSLQLTKTLYDYADKNYISFHTPGHKGKIDLPASVLDVTELEETDNLFHPSGVIEESQKELAASLGCNQVIFLPNGATSGNLGVFYALFREGDKVLVDRNCHISVINALVLSGVMPVFTESSFFDHLPLPVEPKNVKALLEKEPDLKAIFVTSPNYYGMLADIRQLSALAKQHRIPLIVDEAHGTHFYYNEKGQNSALHCGADISILSLHKNLPVLTQCGAIAYNSNDFDRIKQGVKYFTSTSPSYLLMSAMDQLADRMRKKGREDLKKITEYTVILREKIRKIKNLFLIETERYDPTRIVISIKNCNTTIDRLQDYLKQKHRIVCEMTDERHIVFIITLCNTEKELECLYDALLAASDKFGHSVSNDESEISSFSSHMAMSPKAAHFSQKEEIPLSQAVGRIAGENMICFPPSIPIAVLGEQMTKQTIENIRKFAGRESILAVKQEQA